jgi:two-component system chemotaxis response regulator CheY
MPETNGHQAIQKIRYIERNCGIQGSKEVNVIMISALNDPKNVIKAFKKGGASSYLVKPVIREKLYSEIRNMGLIKDPNVYSQRKSISI